MDLLNDSSRAAVTSIRACELFKRLFATALVVLSGVAVTGDMGLTIVFGCTVMLRSEGLQTCTRVDLVFTHQLVTVLATIKDRQTSS